MNKVKNLKLKNVLPFIQFEESVRIYEFGVYTNDYWQEEETYCGSLMDIPWIYLDYYLINDPEGNWQAIGIEEKDNKKYLTINIAERLPSDC